MKKNIYYLFFLFSLIKLENYAQGKKKVLVFYKHIEYEHPSTTDGRAFIKNLGNQNNLWEADETNNSADFNLTNLNDYDAVIWLNTEGNGLLNAAEKTAFETYVKNGGGFVGVHSAADTYHDKSWDFYNQLVGAVVARPRHTTNNYAGVLTPNDACHPSVHFLGNTWNKNDEYYYWSSDTQPTKGQLSTDNQVLLTVANTPSGTVVDPDHASRPICWYKESMTVGGVVIHNIRSFYIGLGHKAINYTGTASQYVQFRQLLENGILYAIGEPLSESLFKHQTNTDAFGATNQVAVANGDNLTLEPNKVLSAEYQWEKPDGTKLTKNTNPATFQLTSGDANYGDWKFKVFSNTCHPTDIVKTIKVVDPTVMSTTVVHKQLVSLVYHQKNSTIALKGLHSTTYQIKIFDALGNLMMDNRLNTSSPKLNIGRLSQGIYYLVLKDNKTQSTIKFVKY